MKTHLVAIVGRPNVGKSTLFNRLTRKWQAIVEDRPGITRDRLYGDFTIFNHKFRIMDTGGLNLRPKDKMEKKVSAQAERGIAEADVILFVMDGRVGPTELDKDWVRKLRKINKPKVFIVNKLDEPKLDAKAQEFYELGISPLILISAEKQRNFSGLSEAILNVLNLDIDSDVGAQFIAPTDTGVINQAPTEDIDPEVVVQKPLRMPNIALIGRPNVGKSTLLNAILEEERSIVDDVPGTTRDPIHTYITRDDKEYCFIDTAGIRKRAKTIERVEKFSVVGSLGVIDKADIVLLLIDGNEGPTDQDAHVAGYAFEKQKAIILVVNKWDEGSKKFSREDFQLKLELKMNYLSYCPLIFISAKTGKNLQRVFQAIQNIQEQYDVQIKTSELNRVFEHIINHHPLPTYKGKDIKMFYATQVGRRPPSFVIFCTEPKHVHFTYKRYLINALREAFQLHNVPIRLIFKKRK